MPKRGHNVDHPRHHHHIAGYLLTIPILITLGIIAAIIGIVLAVLGMTGRLIGGRKYWY